MADLTAVHKVGERYRLSVPRAPISGALGEMMGSGTGNSLEFQDYREYVPGDDPRHIDWAALARSDQLMVRLYREDVAPFADILVDGSRSMDVDGPKGARARELALAFDLFARSTGANPRLWRVGDPTLPIEGKTDACVGQLAFTSPVSFDRPDAWRGRCLRRRSIRVVLSDFLFPHEPDTLVKQLADGASALWLVQLLADHEAAPPVSGGVRLVDVETGEYHDLVLNEGNVNAYLKRLANLQTGLRQATRRAGARFLTVTAGASLDAICRNTLLPAGAVTCG